jgi:signal recognition particle subunit SRP54
MALFENLGDRLGESLRKVAGKSRLSEDNIREALRDVRMALLEADVALSVVKEFIDRVRSRALGMQVGRGLNPGQQFLTPDG